MYLSQQTRSVSCRHKSVTALRSNVCSLLAARDATWIAHSSWVHCSCFTSFEDPVVLPAEYRRRVCKHGRAASGSNSTSD